MTLAKMITETRRLLGGISSAKYSDADITQAINNYKDTFVSKAILSNGQWEVNGEVSTTNIVADQKEYILPINLLSLKRIEINPTGNDNTWEVMTILDMRSKGGAISNETTSTDSNRVRVFDNSLFLEDTPDQNVTAGLKIFWEKEGTDFDGTADETSIFPVSLHTGLIYGACLDYCITKERNNGIANFKALYEEKERELEDYYSNRLKATRKRLLPRQERYI